ncbi:MAG: hypothetical protein KatS3mg110_4363 [Pirellulaceae bacterium]|nr:MAG: hypothetical protein KatS3mg110_4363 [Pirellulaceae bacterium]
MRPMVARSPALLNHRQPNADCLPNLERSSFSLEAPRTIDGTRATVNGVFSRPNQIRLDSRSANRVRVGL